MNDLQKFLKNNEVSIKNNEKINFGFPMYYSSLHDGFLKYFQTFRDEKDMFHFHLNFETWNEESLAAKSMSSRDNTIFAILSFHRFIELVIKDVLRRINPFLAVKLNEKADQLILLLENKLDAEDCKTIEFQESLNRFREAFKQYEQSSSVYTDHLKDYEFLIEKEALESISGLTEWRNRIMHNGNSLPNFYAFEYLMSQRIIPLLNKILLAEQKHFPNCIPYFFETPTGTNIINNILSIKFHFTDCNNFKNHAGLDEKLLKLGHLKELGRASINQNVPLRKNVSFYEPYYRTPIERAERIAESEKNHENFHHTQNCICCGKNTLVTYKVDIDFPWIEVKYVSWFKCYFCDYSLKNNVRDPQYFGLSEKPLFAVE